MTDIETSTTAALFEWHITVTGVVRGGVQHAESGEVRVQQHGSTSQRHQRVSAEDDCVLGRHADQGRLHRRHRPTHIYSRYRTSYSRGMKLCSHW